MIYNNNNNLSKQFMFMSLFAEPSRKKSIQNREYLPKYSSYRYVGLLADDVIHKRWYECNVLVFLNYLSG